MAQFKNVPFEIHPDHGGKVLEYEVKYDDETTDVWYESMSGASSD